MRPLTGFGLPERSASSPQRSRLSSHFRGAVMGNLRRTRAFLHLQAELCDFISGSPVVMVSEALVGGSAYSLSARTSPRVVHSGTASAVVNFYKRMSEPAVAQFVPLLR